MEDTTPELDLPGFRFHPTEEELLDFYLKHMVFGKKLRFDIIRFLNIYHHDPWELPGLAKIGEREWYFFVPRDRKHGSGGRPNRTTENGFWKATGSDRKIVSLSDPKRIIGLRKTLVFYRGRAPRGTKTDWVMNEYRLPDNRHLPEDIVLCKIYRKATSLKVLEQRAAMEEEMKTKFQARSPNSSPPSSSMEAITFCNEQEDLIPQMPVKTDMILKKEVVEDEVAAMAEEKIPEKAIAITESKSSANSIQLPIGQNKLPELQVPKLGFQDWTQDSFWAQFSSPWLQSLTSSANILNYC